MKIEINISDDELREEIKQLLVRRITNEFSYESRVLDKKLVSEIVKEVIYSQKDILIDRCVNKAATELTKKALPKLIDKITD